MDIARVVKALRELADALEADGGTDARTPGKARKSKARAIVVETKRLPPVEISEVDKARARKALRRLGVPV